MAKCLSPHPPIKRVTWVCGRVLGLNELAPVVMATVVAVVAVTAAVARLKGRRLAGVRRGPL